MDTITIEDFAKVEMRVGLITRASNVEKSKKLIRLQVDFSDYGQRIIFNQNQLWVNYLAV